MSVDDQNPVDDIVASTAANGARAGEPGVVNGSADAGFPNATGNGDRPMAGSQENSESLGTGSAAANGTAGPSVGSGVMGQPAIGTPSSGWTGRESRDSRVVDDVSDSFVIENSVTEQPTIFAQTYAGSPTIGTESQGAHSAVEIAEGEFPTDANGLSLDLSVSEENAPAPTHADILTDFMPFNRASLETAIDHILENFDGFGAALADMKVLEGLALPVAAGTAVFVGTEAVLRWRKRAAGRETSKENENLILHPLLGLPA